mmetsp:Transcript_53768/g.135161  ORF Transcript_53768/g.135161 Transcript_53768/m.135161 type:complete len:223 (-) Transcript_53768:813-1481(-)
MLGTMSMPTEPYCTVVPPTTLLLVCGCTYTSKMSLDDRDDRNTGYDGRSSVAAAAAVADGGALVSREMSSLRGSSADFSILGMTSLVMMFLLSWGIGLAGGIFRSPTWSMTSPGLRPASAAGHRSPLSVSCTSTLLLLADWETSPAQRTFKIWIPGSGVTDGTPLQATPAVMHAHARAKLARMPPSSTSAFSGADLFSNSSGFCRRTNLPSSFCSHAVLSML